MDPHYHRTPDQEENQVAVQYFLPAQIVLQLEHLAEMSREELSRTLTAFLQEETDERSWRFQLEPPEHEKFLTFPISAKEDLALSIVPTLMHNEKASKDELINLLLEIHGDLTRRNKYSTAQEDEYEKRLPGIPITHDKSVNLSSVAPNWLMNGAPHVPGLAGPGAWPEAADVPEGYWPMFEILGGQDIGEGDEMHVAVLDAAPKEADLVEAHEKWHAVHPLIDSLLKPGGPLRLYPMNSSDRRALFEYSLLNHRYRMPDHGLFVAGIIHTIAPAASLHLYEVLNPFGVGSLETITRGLIDVLENPEIGRPLIVNCSLVLGASPDKRFNPDLPAELARPNVFRHLTQSVRELFDLLAQQNEIVLVAAAGNDATGHDGKPGHGRRPPARYPAALENVVGIGALPKGEPPQGQRHRGASYSNLSDNPAENGFITLGGEPGKNKGILGVYICDFPQYYGPLPATRERLTPDHVHYKLNETGWAWWAGTSFATPIISGMLAGWWGANPGATSVEVRDFLPSVVAAPTDENEGVVPVSQQAP